MKKNAKLLNNFTISTKDKKGRKRIVNIAGGSKLPRVIYLKMLYGDDYIDYIKDEAGVDNFLNNSFKKNDEKSNFLKNNELVIEFTKNWLVLTNFYKEKYGKNVRDKDAVEKLSKEFNFKTLSNLYDFRCHLFKADFNLSEKFNIKLKRNLDRLEKINNIIKKETDSRNKYLIKNKVW